MVRSKNLTQDPPGWYFLKTNDPKGIKFVETVALVCFNSPIFHNPQKMLRRKNPIFSIMERYRRVRPESLDQFPATQEFRKPSASESQFFSPSSLPCFTSSSYIRSPVPASAKVCVPSTSPITQPADPKRLRVELRAFLSFKSFYPRC